MSDPFADLDASPQSPEAEPVITTSTSKETATVATADSQNKIVITLKGGAGYDAAWSVIHADTVAEANAILKDEGLKELLEQTQKVGKFFASLGSPAPAAKPAAQGQPAGAQQPPAGAPECPPGWTYKTGVTKAGKPYQAYFPPRGSNDKPIWL